MSLIKKIDLPKKSWDLFLRVEETPCRNAGRRLTFHCHSSSPGLIRGAEKYAGEALERNAEEAVWTFFSTLEELSFDTKEKRDVADHRLRSIGLRLAQQILPEPLRHRLWEIHEQVATLKIVSDEAWVPWELLVLKDPLQPERTLFLSEAFALCRWFENRKEATTLPLQRMAVVSPKDTSLKNAKSECAALLGLDTEERKVVRVRARLGELLEQLESGEFDSWHFSGHGLARGESPAHWSLQLEQGDQLKSFDLEGVREGFGKLSPFVFLNACHSSRGGRRLVGAGGLSKAFIDAGAGALVGATWAVDDACAAAFAGQFYAELVAGQPLAEAVRRSRLYLKKAFPGDPTWLAYAAFGHPGARLAVTEEAKGPVPTPLTAPAPHPPPTLTSPLPTPSGRSRKSWSRRGVLKGVAALTAAVALTGLALTFEPFSRPDTIPPQADLSKRPPIQSFAALEDTAPPPADDFAPKRETAVPEPGPSETRNNMDTGEPSHPPRAAAAPGTKKPAPRKTSIALTPPPAQPSELPKSTPLGQELRILSGRPARSAMAALTVSAVFQIHQGHRFIKLTWAPDGREEITKTFFTPDRPSYPIETATGSWRLHVLDVRPTGKELIFRISKEDP